MIRRPPRSTLFPTRRSSDLGAECRTVSHGEHHGRDDRRAPQRRRKQLGDARAAQRARFLALFPDRRFGKERADEEDRKSTRLNSSHSQISYAVFCLKKKKKQ